jgi:hypothetical protein
MAKCMMHVRSLEVKRVSNQEAKRMYKSNDWKYISKNDYDRKLDNNQSEEN